MSIFTILTDSGVGGTFITWSLHYLAGHTEYFNHKTNSWCELISTPLTNINAHNFKPNQPTSYNEFNDCLVKLINCKSNNFHTMYFHNFREAEVNIFTDTQAAVDKVIPVATKLIVLTNQPKNSLYHKSLRSRILTYKLNNLTEINLSNEEQLDDYINHFFKESFIKWKELQLTNTWDKREFIALNFRKNAISIAPCIDLSVDHFDIDCLELFNTADAMISSLFDYLEIKLDTDRFFKWNQIYQSWRELHYNRLNFVWHFDKIIEYILKGYYLDLGRFDLDIVQEAFIQHELIYKHNLGLKTWQLEKFQNTQQLHALLEPNTHLLSTY